MPKDFNETTITIDHDTEVASVWTNNRPIRTKLRKIGAKEAAERAGGWQFTMPASYVGLRKRRSSGGFATKKAGSGSTAHGSLAGGAGSGEEKPRPEGE